jgi:general secretion pathway protein C
MSAGAPLHRRLRRAFPAALVVPVAAIALLTAQGVVQIAAAALALDARALALEARGNPPRVHGSPAFHTTSSAPILARNPFDSQFVLHPPGPDVPPIDDADLALAPACDGVRARAIVASDDADFSFAALDVATGGVVRRRGGPVGSRTVAFVAWDRVWLRDGDRLCQAPVFAEAPGAEPHALVPARPAVTSSGPALDSVIAHGIERVGPTEFRVDRSIVPRILEHQAELSRPHIAMAGSTGARLTAVNPDSLLGALGVESGDVLESVNGIEITNAAGLAELYGRLSHLDHLRAQLSRGGKPVTIDYDIF